MRVLVAGIGNVFFGDDSFGCVVARELARNPVPEGVTVRDFGIRGLDLAFELVEGYDAAIFVDALPRGGSPGTLYVLEPELGQADAGGLGWDAHGLTPEQVLRTVRAIGGKLPLLRVVGCEPAEFGDELDPQGGLSETVSARVPEAVKLVYEVLAELGIGAEDEAVGHA
jgi:hydrogenase maturation protease